MDDLDQYCCPNKNGPQYGLRGEGTIHVRARYGTHKNIRLLYGTTCHEKFSERRGTICFD